MPARTACPSTRCAAAYWLTDDEIVAPVSALVPLGLDHVRLTGGELTLRPRLPQLVARRSAWPDLAMTTNATRLVALAQPLRDAGLHRLNISLDTLDARRFRHLTRGELGPVLAGSAAMTRAGFTRGKLNVVALRGVNDDELGARALRVGAHARATLHRAMPMSDGHVAPATLFLSVTEVRAALGRELGPLVQTHHELPGVGPARYLRARDGELGFIAAVTDPICETCERKGKMMCVFDGG